MRGWVVRLRQVDQNDKFDKRRDTADEDAIGNRAGVSLLRYAAQLFDQCNEGVNQLFTAEELLRIASACERTGWDMLPDQWTPRQLQEAAARGRIPEWRETSGDLVAVYYANGQGGGTIPSMLPKVKP